MEGAMNWFLAISGLLTLMNVVRPNLGYAQEFPTISIEKYIQGYCHNVVQQSFKEPTQANPDYNGLDQEQRFQRCTSDWRAETQKERQSLMLVWRSAPAKVKKACLAWQFRPGIGLYVQAPDETGINFYEEMTECINERGDFLDAKFWQ
jgi:hypothetical protein